MKAAASGEQLTVLRDNDVDVVLLDLMLPGVDGLVVCRTLRARSDLPIIIVSARSDSGDIIAGLEAGADDYVTKPLDAGELAARIRALSRRRRPATDEAGRRFVLGDVEVVPDEGVVRKAGVEVHLTRTELRLLVELLSADGRVVTREALLQQVWGYDYLGDTGCSTCTSDACAARSRQTGRAAPGSHRPWSRVQGRPRMTVCDDDGAGMTEQG